MTTAPCAASMACSNVLYGRFSLQRSSLHGLFHICSKAFPLAFTCASQETHYPKNPWEVDFQEYLLRHPTLTRALTPAALRALWSAMDRCVTDDGEFYCVTNLCVNVIMPVLIRQSPPNLWASWMHVKRPNQPWRTGMLQELSRMTKLACFNLALPAELRRTLPIWR